MEQISVIIPLYQAEKTVKRCLESIIHQTYTELEIIIVDDGSTDKSGDIADYYACLDRRIKVFHQNNKGPSAARNEALKHVRGKYIAFVDADDWIETDMYANMHSLLVKNNADIAICHFYMDGSIENSFDKKRNKLFGEDNMILLSKERAIQWLFYPWAYRGYLWNKLFKTELLKKDFSPYFDEKTYYCEDLIWAFKRFQDAKKIVYTNNKYYHYNLMLENNNFTSSKLSDKHLTVFQVHQRLLEDSHEHAIKSAIICHEVMLAMGFIRSYYLQQCTNESILNYLKMIIRRGSFRYIFSNQFGWRTKIGVAVLLFSPKLFVMLR